MELIVKPCTLPEAFEFNYEELKTELTERVKTYETTVYTDDLIKEAKADRSTLNKLKKALNDERVRREREYLEPFQDFKGKITELCGIIDKASACVDSQVKAYEEKCRQEKKTRIEALFEETEGRPEWLTLGQIWNDKWLNASTTLKAVNDEMTEKISKIKADCSVLIGLVTGYNYEALEIFKKTLSMDAAMQTVENLKKAAEARKRAEEEKAAQAAQARPDPEPTIKEMESEDAVERQWIAFEALLSVGEAKHLAAFFRDYGIEYRAIKR